MSLAKEVRAKAGQSQQQQPRVNPEIDRKLNEFIAANPKLAEYYKQQPREQLERKLMLGKMNEFERRERVNGEIRQWVDQRPDVKERIERRLAQVPEAEKSKIFIGLAKSAMQNETLKAAGLRQGQG